MGLDGFEPPTPRDTGIELPRVPSLVGVASAGFEFSEYCSHAVNYKLHYSAYREFAVFSGGFLQWLEVLGGWMGF